MNDLWENPLAIWVCGAVLVTLAAVVYFQRPTRAALAGLASVVLLTAALLLVEHMVVTDREAVEQTLYDLAATIEANNLPGVLEFIAPSADEVRADAEALMPRVEVEKARILGTPEITLDESAQPRRATVHCRGLVDVTLRQSGMRGPYADRVEIHWVQSADRWLIERYTPQRDWRRARGGR